MHKINVFLINNIFDIPALIIDKEPGGGKDIDALYRSEQASDGIIPFYDRHIMPGHVDFLPKGPGPIIRLGIGLDRLRLSGIGFSQGIVLHIAEYPVLRHDAGPGIHGLQDPDCRTGFGLTGDLTLDAARDPDHGRILYIRHRFLIPGVDQHQAVGFRISAVGKIGVILHKIQRQPEGLPVQDGRGRLFLAFLSAVRRPGGLAGYQDDPVIGQTVKDLSVRFAEVEALCQMRGDILQLHIISAVEPAGMHFGKGVLKNDRKIIFVLDPIVSFQIRPFSGVAHLSEGKFPESKTKYRD